MAVPGRVAHDVIETESVFVGHWERLVRTRGMPPHVERYQRAAIGVRALLVDQS